jgi:hypothetical protein
MPDRQRFHERVIRMMTRQGIDLFVVGDNSGEKLFEQTFPGHNSGTARYQHCGISRCRNFLLDLIQTFRNALSVSAVVIDGRIVRSLLA